MVYETPLYRPPSEASSLIVQITLGCSHNKCTFCGMYKDKNFYMKSFEEIKEHIDTLASSEARMIKRVFLADGNALAVDTNTLIKTLDYLYEKFPTLERVGIYSGPKDILNKSIEDLKKLKEHGLTLHYLGIESGSDKILKMVNKGVTAAEIVEAGKKIMDNGHKLSATIILGLGGRELMSEHAKETARVCNEIEPTYLAALTLMEDPRAPIYKKIEKGEFQPLDSIEILKELELLIKDLELKETVFRSNHASNYLALKGTLNKDKEKLLEVIRLGLKEPDKAGLRPEYLRGL